MTKIQGELKVLLIKDGWELFRSESKGKSVIMQKEIKGVMIYLSIKEDGSLYFNRSTV
jgi:hypothetical protein